MKRLGLAKQFSQRVVEDVGDSVDSIRLYGSVAHGKDGGDSDIDILIVAKKHKPEVDDKIHSIVVDFLHKTRELFSHQSS